MITAIASLIIGLVSAALGFAALPIVSMHENPTKARPRLNSVR